MMKHLKEYRKPRKRNIKQKNQTKYSLRDDCVSAQKEIKDIQDMRKSLGMKPLELTTRQCLKCDAEIFVFRCSSVWMCKACRGLKESKENDNQTY